METDNTKLPPNLNVGTPAPGTKTPGALDETKTDDLINDDEDDVEEKEEKTEKKGNKNKGKKIEVDEDLLKKLIDINEKNAKEIERLSKREKILTEAADVKRLTKVEELRNQGKLVKEVNVAMIEDKYVIYSKRVKDEVYFNSKNELVENQLVEYFFNKDEGSIQLPDNVFASRRKPVACEVIEEKKSRDGETTLVVQTPEGEELTIGLPFINL